jgi:D-alanyl-D-alanine carboxypeptidase (penicillin-binding protein 5/6)
MKRNTTPAITIPSLSLIALAIALAGVPPAPLGAEASADGPAAAYVKTAFTEAAEPQPALRSRAAALYDVGTETLLYSKNGDEEIPPASMTKLVTLHLVYRAIERGELSRDTEVEVGRTSDFHSLPPRSSLMFLEEGQRLTVLELMRGLAVPSGNDAALLVARLVAGSTEAFVARMNGEMRRLGLEHTRFVDPSGLSAENRTTAREFARFCMYYLRSHPRSLEELHDLYRFTYPKERNLPEGGSSTYGPITQYNHNRLAWGHPWVDGLKTGYIEESGYNVAVTGSHRGRRLVAVLLGGPGNNSEEGTLTRAIDGANLLSFGFYAFTRVRPQLEEAPRPRVWKSATGSLTLALPEPAELSIPKELAGAVELELRLEEPLIAPISRGDRVGELVVRVGERVRSRQAVRAAEEAPVGGWLRRVVDGLRLGLR